MKMPRRSGLDPDIGRFLWSLAIGGALALLALAGLVQVQAHTRQQQADAIPSLPAIAKQVSRSSSQVPLDFSLGLLNTIDPDTLTRPQWQYWLRCVGDTYANNLGEPGTPRFRERLRLAHRSYGAALDSETLPGRQNDLRLSLATLHATAEEWTTAVAFYQQVDFSQVSASRRAGMSITWGRCLVQLGDRQQAVEVLDAVITGGRWEERQQGLLSKLQLLISVLEDPTSQLPSAERESLQQLARDTYTALDADTTLSTVARRQVQLAACRLDAMAGDYPALLERVRKLQVSSTSRDVKLEALTILTRAMVDLQRLEDSELVVESLIDPFRGRPRAAAAIGHLFEPCLRLWHPSQALDICRRAILSYSDPHLAEHMLRAIMAEGSGFFAQTQQLAAFGDADLQMELLMRAISNRYSDDWGEARRLAWLLRARLAALAGKWQEADTCLTEHLRGLPGEMRPEAALLDMQVGIHGVDSPAVLAVRAQRFLKQHPEHPEAVAALYQLIGAYQQMSLHEASMRAAQRAFLRTIWDVGQNAAQVADEQWLMTISRVLQGYVAMGEYDKADLLFKMYGAYLLKLPQAGSVLADCARAAVGLDQPFEAVRRFDLAIDRCADATLQQALEVEAAELALGCDYPRAVPKAQALLKTLATPRDSLDPTWVRDARRRLHNALLAHAYAHHPSSVRTELEQVPESFGGEPWLSAWVLRVMSQELKDRELEAWREEHAAIIATGISGKVTDDATSTFLKQQVRLIDGLIELEARMSEISNRGKHP